MAKLGRLVVDGSGTILEVDTAFCATMRMAPGGLIGRNALNFTAPADRDRCVAVLARVLGERIPLATVKRMLRADGTHVWVSNSLRPIEQPGAPIACEILSDEAVPPSDWVEPATLLRVARFILASRRAREKAFSAHFFGDPAWDIMVLAYVSEAEGRTLSTADLHASIGISLGNASRWIRALNAEELIEYEDDGASKALVTAPIRLSSSGHRRLERFLSSLHEAAGMEERLDWARADRLDR
jgi:PAS domain S-box-containing protein